MGRRFKIGIGEKTFIVDVEELSPQISKTVTTSTTQIKEETKPLTIEKPIIETELSNVKFVKAPLPGAVISIKCNVGDKVKTGDVLLILEAMKMENEIYSPANGVIKKINISQGEKVSSGIVLVEIDLE
jgi:biotin carboxyl carrier protein